MAWLPGVFNSGNKQQQQQQQQSSGNGGGGGAADIIRNNQPPQLPGSGQQQQQSQQDNQNNQGKQEEDLFAEFRDAFTHPGGQQNQGQQWSQGQQQQQQQVPPKPTYEGYTAEWNGEAVSQRLNSVDFTRSIDPELITKAMGGDVGSFSQVLNLVARQSTMAAMQAAHTFVDRGVKTGLDRFDSGLDDRMRDYSIRSHNPENDILNDPAVAPMVATLKERFAQADRNLTPAQINAKVVAYFQKLSTGMSSGTKQQQQSQQQGTDWLDSLGF